MDGDPQLTSGDTIADYTAPADTPIQASAATAKAAVLRSVACISMLLQLGTRHLTASSGAH